MASIIQELQSEILDKNSATADLLRKGLVIAQKLDLKAMHKWVKNELYGYYNTSKIPRYRVVTGEIEVFDYSHNRWFQVYIANSKLENRITSMDMEYSVHELESILLEKDNFIPIPLEKKDETNLIKSLNLPSKPSLIIMKTQLAAIIDNTKSLLLEWCLNLEEVGITGKGLSFSSKEVKSAKSINVFNFHKEIINSQINNNTVDSKLVNKKNKGAEMSSDNMLKVACKRKLNESIVSSANRKSGMSYIKSYLKQMDDSEKIETIIEIKSDLSEKLDELTQTKNKSSAQLVKEAEIKYYLQQFENIMQKWINGKDD